MATTDTPSTRSSGTACAESNRAGAPSPVPIGRTGLGVDPARQAYLVLRAAFVLAPIVVGLDKFTNWLVQWDQYLAPVLSDPLPVTPHQAMYAVGVVEVVAGIVVALHPRLGGLVVAAWLAGIIVNLVLIPGYYDVALRDFGLLLSAVALQRLATRYDPRPLAWPLSRG
jgi:uncharacterized membrane protein YphA (DoxX/SURF4 family)